MSQIKIEKITLNIGAGTNQNLLKKGMMLLEKLTGSKPTQTRSKKRIPGWKLRPGLPIGCMVTLRGENARKVLKQMLGAKENILPASNFDMNGNVAFGVKECIDIPGLEYDPEIGIIGLQICVSLERQGHRIKRRRIRTKKLPRKQRISKDQSIEYFKNEFKLKVET